jgi:hypothetical protein
MNQKRPAKSQSTEYRSGRENMQIYCFSQLTKNNEGAKAVKMYGVVPLVVDAYNNSQNNAIAAYATVILRNLGVERPDFRHNSHSSTDTLGSNGRIVQQVKTLIIYCRLIISFIYRSIAEITDG